MSATKLPYGIALPALSDPASMAVMAPGKIELAEQLLDVQLKLHLLTSEHLIFSHGFLYDNPAIWALLDTKLVENLAKPLHTGGKSALIIQMDESALKLNATTDPDSLFRVWAFGSDGAPERTLRPSAPIVLGLDARQAVEKLKNLDRRKVTVEEYAGAMSFGLLDRAKGDIAYLLGNCHRQPRLVDRHSAFTASVRSFANSLGALRANRVPSGLEGLYDDVDKLNRILDSNEKLSRSAFDKEDSELWWKFAPYLNHYRLRAYLPADESPSMSFLPSTMTEAIEKLVVEADAQASKLPDWAVVLEKINFDAIFEMRSKKYFREVLEKLGAISLGKDIESYNKYVKYLNDSWSKALEAAVAECAPDALLKKSGGSGSWIGPASTIAGVGIGGTAGASLATMIGVAAITGASIGTGVGAALTLTILGVRSIRSRFVANTPEKSASIIATRLLGEFKSSK